MGKYLINPSEELEFDIYTLGHHLPNPLKAEKRIHTVSHGLVGKQ